MNVGPNVHNLQHVSKHMTILTLSPRVWCEVKLYEAIVAIDTCAAFITVACVLSRCLWICRSISKLHCQQPQLTYSFPATWHNLTQLHTFTVLSLIYKCVYVNNCNTAKSSLQWIEVIGFRRVLTACELGGIVWVGQVGYSTRWVLHWFNVPMAVFGVRRRSPIQMAHYPDNLCLRASNKIYHILLALNMETDLVMNRVATCSIYWWTILTN